MKYLDRHNQNSLFKEGARREIAAHCSLHAKSKSDISRASSWFRTP